MIGLCWNHVRPNLHMASDRIRKGAGGATSQGVQTHIGAHISGLVKQKEFPPFLRIRGGANPHVRGRIQTYKGLIHPTFLHGSRCDYRKTYIRASHPNFLQRHMNEYSVVLSQYIPSRDIH